MTIIFDEVLKLAEQLDTAQQELLIYRLRLKQLQHALPAHPMPTESSITPTHEALLHYAQTLRTIPARPEDRLLGKYADPTLPEISEAEFHAQLHAIATEWEQELDEFTSDTL